MPSIGVITKSAEETKKAGIALSHILKKEASSNRVLIIALKGNLGAGKTTFIQGLAEGLGIKENVLSPTFLIIKEFPILINQSNFRYFYHIDTYRIKNSDEILELGFEDLINNPENIIVIEWADKIKNVLPKNILWINFENLGENKRKIILSI